MLARIASLLRVGVPDQHESGLLRDSGPEVPADGTAGYATGCLFQHTDGGNGTALYVNEGDTESCDFDPVTTG